MEMNALHPKGRPAAIWKPDWKDGMICLAIIVLSALWILQFYDLRANLLDEGFVVNSSGRIMQGQVPFKDFFSLVPPGSFLLHAALFKVFGKSLLTGRYLIVLIGALLPALTYLISRCCLNRGFAVTASVLGLVWGPASFASEDFLHANYSWIAATLILWALWHATRYLSLSGCISLTCERGARSPSRSTDAISASGLRAHLAWCGVGLGLALAVKHTNGAFALIPLSSVLLWSDFLHARPAAKNILIVWGAAVLVNLPWLAWIAVTGGLTDMVRDLIIIPWTEFRGGAYLHYPYPNWPAFPALSPAASRTLASAVPLSFPLLGLFVLGRRLIRAEAMDARVVLILAVASCLFISAFPRSDMIHILYALPPGWIVLTIAARECWILIRPQHAWARMLLGVTFAILLVRPFIAEPLRYAYWSNDKENVPLRNPNAGVLVSEKAASELQPVLDEIMRRTKPGDYLFVLPWYPLIYFLTDTRNPTRHDIIFPGNFGRGSLEQMIADLKVKRPEYVVWYRGQHIDGMRFEDYAAILAHYVEQNYAFESSVGPYEFRKIKK